MTWKCDVCGKSIHIRREGNRNKVLRCPLEAYKKVKSFYSPQIKNLLGNLYFDTGLPLSNSPEDLTEFKERIPEISPLSNYVRIADGDVYTQTLIVQARIETFFLHFNRILINIFDSNKIHYVEPSQEAQHSEFNYLWVSTTHLRESYFGGRLKHTGFKSLTDLGVPSLILLPFGKVGSIKHKGWGDILLDLITHRESTGKATWLIVSKNFETCQEYNSSERLRKYLNSEDRVTVELDEKEDLDDFDFTPDNEIQTTGTNSVRTHNYAE